MAFDVGSAIAANDPVEPKFFVPLSAPSPQTPVPVDIGDPKNSQWKPAWSTAAVATQFVSDQT